MDWWALAGVDVTVADSPQSWLGGQKQITIPPVEREGNDAPAPLAAVPPSPSLAMPDTLHDFLRWLEQEPSLPEAGFPGGRILPRTVASARLLVITDVPTDEDVAAGRLLSGGDGELMRAMLRAMGLDEGEVGVAGLLLTRPPGGICDDGIWAAAAERLRHYIALTSPGGLLLFGDQTSRALGETAGANNGELSGNINHIGLMMSAMRLPAPNILMRHPARKAAAWADLRKLAAGR